MSKNSIKNVIKNAETQKVFELLENEIGNDKTSIIQQNIINTLQNEHKIEISIDDFSKEKAGLNKKDFVKFIDAFLSELCLSKHSNLKIQKIIDLLDTIEEMANRSKHISIDEYMDLFKQTPKAICSNPYNMVINVYLLYPKICDSVYSNYIQTKIKNTGLFDRIVFFWSFFIVGVLMFLYAFGFSDILNNDNVAKIAILMFTACVCIMFGLVMLYMEEVLLMCAFLFSKLKDIISIIKLFK